jgi:hypothetical protein
MLCRAVIAATTLAATLLVSIATLQAFDDTKYPDLSGQWTAVRLGVRGQPAFDPTKPWGLGQEAPLTPEYQKVLEASLEDQKNGGQGNWRPGDACLPPGMPAMMTLYQAMEIIVLPETTYIRTDHTHESFRRIYTMGAPGRRLRSNRPLWATPSGNGSMKMATANTTRSKSRPDT